MTRFAKSWRLAQASWAVLRSDKDLIVFPIVSGIGAILVTLLFAGPLWLTGYFDALGTGGRNSKILGFVVLFLLYLVLYAVINFCNAALVGAALIRLRGGDPSASDGFRLARSRLAPILGYSAIGATVGVALQVVKERAGDLGMVVGWMGETAWNLVTYLAIPVLVVEDVGPIEAIKRSGGLLKRTWGEQVIGNFGIGLAMGLIALGAIVAGGALIALAAATGLIVLIVPAIAVAVVAVAAALAVGASLKGIYTAALYRYAADGAIGQSFDGDLIRQAFTPKSARRNRVRI